MKFATPPGAREVTIVSSVRSRKYLTADQLTCASLAATGEYSQAMIAAHLGKSPATIQKWMEDERVQAEFRRILKVNSAASVAKARKVLDRSMASDAANGYLALNAAQTVLARYDADVMGEDKQEITVHITGGMPAIGMPERTDDE